MRILYVILDGAADKPIPQLNYITTLEAAYTPNLDYFARKSIGGLVYTVGKGIAPESDVAVYSMLGYKVKEGYIGRGVVEALGAGLEFEDGNLALRGNFATVNDNMTIVDRRVGRTLTSDEAKSLAEKINEKIKLFDKRKSVIVKATVGHRCVVVFRAEDTRLSDNITNTDPAYLKMHGMGVAVTSGKEMKVSKCEPLDRTIESKVSAELVNEFTEKVYNILKDEEINRKRRAEGKLEANMILLRDAGCTLPKLVPLEEKFGLKTAIVADMPVEIGIAKTLKADVFTISTPFAFKEKAERITELLKEYGLVYAHLKGPDEPAHDGNYIAKKKIIEEIDKEFFGVLKETLNLKETLLIVSSDHTTAVTLKAHTDDPVPFIISSEVVEKDMICRFTEKECAKGRFGVLEEGNLLLPLVKSLIK
ncbi:MAG: alkaline phosphatase family protein [Nitrososphaeria archaeon]|nr:alkaline phosphatase family protein [Nitrososphaeria archaeon]